MLTDGQGDIRLNMRIQRLDTFEEVFEQSASIRFEDPLQNIRCVFRFRECSFPIAGAYEAILFANDALIAQRRFRIIQKEKK